jgi:hypothetical protein
MSAPVPRNVDKRSSYWDEDQDHAGDSEDFHTLMVLFGDHGRKWQKRPKSANFRQDGFPKSVAVSPSGWLAVPG